MEESFAKMWQPLGAMDVIDLENDYFMVKLEDWQDAHKAYFDWPRVISNDSLIVQRWQPEFFPFEDEFKRVAVWVRIRGLPIEYYNKHIL